MIRNIIKNKWRYQGDIQGLYCNINITQSDNGNVLSISLKDCNGDSGFKNSIKKAIWESSPLPLPKNQLLFDKNIQLYFKVD